MPITINSFSLFSVKGGLTVGLGKDASGIEKTAKLSKADTTLTADYSVTPDSSMSPVAAQFIDRIRSSPYLSMSQKVTMIDSVAKLDKAGGFISKAGYLSKNVIGQTDGMIDVAEINGQINQQMAAGKAADAINENEAQGLYDQEIKTAYQQPSQEYTLTANLETDQLDISSDGQHYLQTTQSLQLDIPQANIDYSGASTQTQRTDISA